MEKNFIDSWKNENVSNLQLELNIKELSDKKNYPAHWLIFLDFVKDKNIKSIFDLGCGVGSYYKLLTDNNIEIDYTGADYSENAISIAKKHWNYDKFLVKNLWDLTKEDAIKYELLHMGALLDVLPDGDQALDFILSLGFKNIFISRILMTKNESNYEVYKAYNEIKTYSYKHNQKNLILMFEKHNYMFEFIQNNVFLKK